MNEEINILEEFKQTKMGNIPIDWKHDLLENLSTKVMVGIASAATHAYRDDGIILFRNQNIKEGFLDDSDILYIDPEYEKAHKNKRLKGGDLLTARTGYPGTTCKVPDKYEGSQSFTTLITRPNPQIINPDFLCFYINSSRGQNFFESTQIGGGQKNVNAGSLSQMPIPVPSLSEQQKIAEILSTWDQAISTTQSLINELKLRNKGLAQQLLTGKKRLKGFGGKWEELRADKIFKSHTNKSHLGNFEVLSATQERGVIPRAMNNIDIKFDRESLGTYKKVEKGDYVISLRSFQGGIEYSEYEGIVSPAYTVLKEIVAISKTFYKIYFKTETFISRLNTIIYGIRDGKQINYKDFSTLKIPYPPIEEQKAISAVLEMAEKELNLNHKQIENLKEQKKGLMQKLLTGEIRVNTNNKD